MFNTPVRIAVWKNCLCRELEDAVELDSALLHRAGQVPELVEDCTADAVDRELEALAVLVGVDEQLVAHDFEIAEIDVLEARKVEDVLARVVVADLDAAFRLIRKDEGVLPFATGKVV